MTMKMTMETWDWTDVSDVLNIYSNRLCVTLTLLKVSAFIKI